MEKRRSGLVTASLVLSALIHGMALELPGWSLPQTADNPVEPLRATLVTAPRPALTAPAAPTPAEHPRPKPPPPKPKTPPAESSAPTASLPPVEATEAEPAPASPEASSPGSPETAPPAQVAAAEGAPQPSPLEGTGPAWPRQGRIVYDVFRGEKDFLAGTTEHSWEQDGRTYRMKTVVETVGLAALVHSFHYVQRSEGRITAGGLVPEHFNVEQEGRPGEGADFDWSAGEVAVHRAKGPERRAPIRPGDQDVLSIWHQLAIMGEPAPNQRLTLVSNKSAAPAELIALGVEALDLPIGHLMAHHLRARTLDGSLSLDIWLAEQYGYLPVRIRVVDRQNEIYDQRAREIVRDETVAPTAAAPQERKKNE